MRVFLSYHSPDEPAALALKAAIEARERAARVFVAPSSLNAGAFWLPQIGAAITEADAFLLLLGAGLGAWQKLEYYEALDRRARDPAFPIVPVVTTATTPGLPFLRQLHWIGTPTPHTDPYLSAIISALKGEVLAEVTQPWRATNPYRGLPALREDDAAYFFGRDAETTDILRLIEQRSGKAIALVGNSGVGKSSLVQAGVVGALKRQRLPGAAEAASGLLNWPSQLKASRSWAYLTMRPGESPIRALASAFTGLWFQERGDPKRHDWVDGWEARLNGKGRLKELLDDTQARYIDAKSEPPTRIVLYIDQCEELYASRLPRQSMQRFSEIVAETLDDPRLLVLASQRSDYYGELQANAALFPLTDRVDVAPLGAKALRVVLTEPAQVLGATFESDGVVGLLVDAAKDQPGALPLLADHMSDLWSRMQARDDGVIRIADRSELIQVSSALVHRADQFLAEHAADLEIIKRLFCLQLAHVPREGEPVRRRAPRSNCTDAEWSLIEQLSGADWRLLVTGEVDGIAQAEIAHEVLLREWPTLVQWLLEQREFLAWRGEMEHARRQAEALPAARKSGALLMGRALEQAEEWLARRPDDIGAAERNFIQESVRNRRRQGRAIMYGMFVSVFGLVATVLGILYLSQFRAGLIEARIQSMMVQGEIIVAAIAASATAEQAPDPERFLELQADESRGPSEAPPAGIEFTINPERVAPVLRRLVAPTNTRARLYDRDGVLLLDSRNLDDVLRFDLPPPSAKKPGLLERGYVAVRTWFSRGTLPLYRELAPQEGKGYQEVANALKGFKSSIVRINERGEVIVSVAVPAQRFRAVLGALMLSTQGAEIDDMATAQLLATFWVSLIGLVVTLVLAGLAVLTVRRALGLK